MKSQTSYDLSDHSFHGEKQYSKVRLISSHLESLPVLVYMLIIARKLDSKSEIRNLNI